MKIKINEIQFIKELYPRFELDNYTVNQYRQSIDQLPPILISKNNILIDGYHRIQAHKLEELDEIDSDVFDSDDETEILLEAIRRNSSHGKQLSISEKKGLAKRLFTLFKADIAKPSDRKKKIEQILSVNVRTIVNWTKDLDKEEKEDLS